MSKPQALYKTTIVIWTEYPTDNVSIDTLAAEACTGDAYCSSQKCELISDPNKFPNTEFFGDDDENIVDND
jgi:hypothetical protein